MRVAVLAGGWAGFNDAACRALASRGVELLVVRERSTADTAYAEHEVGSYAQEVTWEGDPPDVTDLVATFAPDVVITVSWHRPAYRAALKAVPEGTLRVVWMDNVWRSTAKQWLGRVVAPVWVRSLFDCAFVPSDRSEFFARRLGFGEADVIRGALSADTSVFGSAPRTGDELASRRRFAACLRLVHHKGADVLAEAYADYRRTVDDPWSLSVAGLGPLASAFDGLEGAELLGFRQPSEVADLMRTSSCLVVPSREEPYGVIVHEGAACGLPIVSTYFVGAVPSFVQDGANGYVVPGSDAAGLADAMRRLHALDPDRLAAMSDVSRGLGARLTSDGWARHLHEELERRLERLRSPGR